MVTLKMAENDYAEQELELEKDKKALKAELVEMGLTHEEEIKALCLVSYNSSNNYYIVQ